MEGEVSPLWTEAHPVPEKRLTFKWNKARGVVRDVLPLKGEMLSLVGEVENMLHCALALLQQDQPPWPLCPGLGSAKGSF